jgi:membrane protein implicated in regulation of membrane protease activity
MSDTSKRGQVNRFNLFVVAWMRKFVEILFFALFIVLAVSFIVHIALFLLAFIVLAALWHAWRKSWLGQEKTNAHDLNKEQNNNQGGDC